MCKINQNELSKIIEEELKEKQCAGCDETNIPLSIWPKNHQPYCDRCLEEIHAIYDKHTIGPRLFYDCYKIAHKHHVDPLDVVIEFTLTEMNERTINHGQVNYHNVIHRVEEHYRINQV